MALSLPTRSLRLRPLAESDQTFYCRLYTNAAVMIRVGPPLTQEAAQSAFTRVLRQVSATPPRSHYWMLHAQAADAPLGLMALVPDRDNPTSAEVGVLLLPEAQGQGHATEAIAALADNVFAAPGLQRLWTRHASGNAAAVGLMRKLGFVARRDTSDAWAQSRWQLLRTDWPATRS
jgi:RimJ/RimL family protein N-acetyltransferase